MNLQEEIAKESITNPRFIDVMLSSGPGRVPIASFMHNKNNEVYGVLLSIGLGVPHGDSCRKIDIIIYQRKG